MSDEREKSYREKMREQGLEDEFDWVETTGEEPATVIFFGGLREDEEPETDAADAEDEAAQ